MPSTPESEITSEINVVENARIGYQAALDFAAFYGNTIWSMYNAMLVANGILIAGATIVITNDSPLPFLEILIPITGVLLCFTWFLLVKRSHDYSAYYILSAREIEETYLCKSVQTISRGGAFGSGKTVILYIDEGKRMQRMSLWGRLIKSEYVSYAIILVFVMIYVGIFIQI